MADYINKEITIERIRYKKPHVIASEYGLGYEQGLKEAIGILNATPAADLLSINQWISCKDKMPADGIDVLICARNRMINLAWYDKDMGYFYVCDSDYKYNSLDVTHWMPLPELPKDGEKNDRNDK